MRILSLQCKFLLVEWLNITYNIVPNPLRKLYLSLFGIRIGSGSCIHRWCKFFHVGKLTIGKNSVVNFGCYLDNRRGITIGDNVGIAHNVKIYTLGHNIDSLEFETKGKPVCMEDGVFVFANAIIMPGVILHKNAIVLPGSIVTKDVEENAVVGGNPAKVLKYRNVSTPLAGTIIGSPYEERRKCRMNIMFLLKSLNMGGVEIVTATLANKFVCEGHHVCIFSFFEPEVAMTERIDKRITIYQLRNFCVSDENVQAMRAAMIEEKTDAVINQWGLPVVPIRVINKAAKGLGIKVITVYHNMPNANGRVQIVDMKIAATNNPMKKGILKLQRKAYEMITGAAMHYNYTHSDRYMVLSPSFVDIFKHYAKIKDGSKLIVQTNPVTIEDDVFVYDKTKKQKEIIYVGRIDRFQKHVYRVIDTWEILEKGFPDWCLTLIGDGEDRERLEGLVLAKGLKRVYFEGFKSPIEYYKRASILLLTSEFEGFPLVLAECMSFGVVPVVYDSYPAVFDILKDNVNGLIIPYCKNGYDATFAADKMSALMNVFDVRQRMAINAIATSKRFSLDDIYKSWMRIFENL